jgi:hypothetical protein
MEAREPRAHRRQPAPSAETENTIRSSQPSPLWKLGGQRSHTLTTFPRSRFHRRSCILLFLSCFHSFSPVISVSSSSYSFTSSRPHGIHGGKDSNVLLYCCTGRSASVRLVGESTFSKPSRPYLLLGFKVKQLRWMRKYEGEIIHCA